MIWVCLAVLLLNTFIGYVIIGSIKNQNDQKMSEMTNLQTHMRETFALIEKELNPIKAVSNTFHELADPDRYLFERLKMASADDTYRAVLNMSKGEQITRVIDGCSLAINAANSGDNVTEFSHLIKSLALIYSIVLKREEMAKARAKIVKFIKNKQK